MTTPLTIICPAILTVAMNELLASFGGPADRESLGEPNHTFGEDQYCAVKGALTYDLTEALEYGRPDQGFTFDEGLADRALSAVAVYTSEDAFESPSPEEISIIFGDTDYYYGLTKIQPPPEEEDVPLD